MLPRSSRTDRACWSPCALPAFAVCNYAAKTRFLPGTKTCADGSAVWHQPVEPIQVSGNARPASDSPNDTGVGLSGAAHVGPPEDRRSFGVGRQGDAAVHADC